MLPGDLCTTNIPKLEAGNGRTKIMSIVTISHKKFFYYFRYLEFLNFQDENIQAIQ